MREVQDRGPGGRHVEVPGLSPVRAFLVVCTLAAVLGGAFFATRDASPSEPPAQASPRSPDYSLTNAEAIAEFERLKNLLNAAYAQRDVTLIDEFAAPSAAPGIRRIDNEIRELLADGVLYRTREVRESLEVTSNGPNEIVLREAVVKSPRFVSEATGRNLATISKAERQEIVWVLRRYDSSWRIFSSTIVSAEYAAKGAACC